MVSWIIYNVLINIFQIIHGVVKSCFCRVFFENIYGFPGKIVVENLTKIFWKSRLTLQESILINGYKKILVILIKDITFSTYAKCYDKLTFLLPDAQKKVCLCQGVRRVSFSECFAHVINE